MKGAPSFGYRGRARGDGANGSDGGDGGDGGERFSLAPRTLERELGSARRDIDLLGKGDVVIDHPRRVILRSPNGHYWALNVDDLGALTTTDIGTAL